MELVKALLQLTAVLVVCIPPVESLLCKWSNEGCTSDGECCSERCEQGHPGTDARCTKSMLHQPCLYTYQCSDRLKCGYENKCCSNYWGTCRLPTDCCEEQHYCLEVAGFYYKRCLSGTVVNIPSLAAAFAANHYCSVFTTLPIFLALFLFSCF